MRVVQKILIILQICRTPPFNFVKAVLSFC